MGSINYRMVAKKFIWIILLIVFQTTACSDDSGAPSECFPVQSENGTAFSRRLTLVKDGSRSFALDTLTGFYHQSFHCFTIDGKDYLSFIDAPNRRILFYEYASGEIEKPVYLEEEGPNGVGSTELMGHYVHRLDSIFVLSYWQGRLYLLDGEGMVRNSVKLYYGETEEDQPFHAYPKILTEKPAYLVERKFYLSGRSMAPAHFDQTQTTNVIRVDLDDLTVERLLPRPALYNCGDWGFDMKHRLYNSYNPDRGTFVYSFGADPFVYETDFEKIEAQHFLGSAFFDRVEPFSYEKEQVIGVDVPKEDLRTYEFTTPEYGAILYDPFHRLYYRFVNLPVRPEQIASLETKRYFKPVSVIIADTSFKKIGEVELPRKTYYYFSFFINKEGLHIVNVNA